MSCEPPLSTADVVPSITLQVSKDTVTTNESFDVTVIVASPDGAPIVDPPPSLAFAGPVSFVIDTISPETWRVTPSTTGNLTISAFLESGRGLGQVQQTDSVRVMQRWMSVSVGSDHSCALIPGGQPFCWGHNNAGQLGEGKRINTSSIPIPVGGSLFFESISAVHDRTCGTTANAQSFCWGVNLWGALGVGSQAIFVSVPTPIVGIGFARVAVGDGHGCGIGVLGELYCWGKNSSGELAEIVTPTTCEGVPCSRVPVRSPVPLTFSDVSLGEDHVCAVASTSSIFCWGDSRYGANGNGNGSTLPVGAGGGYQFVRVSSGQDFSCGLTVGGEIACWGRNSVGQLGVSSSFQETCSGFPCSRAPVPVGGVAAKYIAVAAGTSHACGLSTDSLAICWGDNEFGELGHTRCASSCAPSLVSGGLRFASISGGLGNTCGIIASGALYCWGKNWYGELGNGVSGDPGSSARSATPTRVQDPGS